MTVSYQNGKLHSASVQQIFTSIVPVKHKKYIIQAQPEKRASPHVKPSSANFFSSFFFSAIAIGA